MDVSWILDQRIDGSIDAPMDGQILMEIIQIMFKENPTMPGRVIALPSVTSFTYSQTLRSHNVQTHRRRTGWISPGRRMRYPTSQCIVVYRVRPIRFPMEQAAPAFPRVYAVPAILISTGSARRAR